MESPWKKVPWREGMTLLTAIDAHTAGGPLRLITSGLPELSGKTILERQRCSDGLMRRCSKGLVRR